MVTPARPVRIPKNLRYVPYIMIPVIALQSYVFASPPKQTTGAAYSKQVSPLTFASGKLVVRKGTGALANNTQVSPGDTLTYQIQTTNIFLAPIIVQPRLALDDILQYATLIDVHGATVANNHAIWPQRAVAGRQTVSESLTVKIQANPSSKAQGSKNKQSYDSKIQARYGFSNSTLKLQPSNSKQIELYVRKLPAVPALAGLLTSLGLATVWATLYIRAKRGQLASQTPGALLLGWFIGSGTALLACLTLALRNGFALSGNEVFMGGLFGAGVAAIVLVINRQLHPANK